MIVLVMWRITVMLDGDWIAYADRSTIDRPDGTSATSVIVDRPASNDNQTVSDAVTSPAEGHISG